MASDYGRGASVIFDAEQESYWTNQQYDRAVVLTSAEAGAVGCSQCTLTFARTEATGIREDVADLTLTMFADAGIATPIGQLSAANMATVEGFLDSWWTTVKAHVTPHWSLSSYRWRDVSAAGPISTKTGLVMPSPTRRITARSVAGTHNSGYPPDQAAMSVTLRTASRLHWGRVYVPGITADDYSSYGRFLTTSVDGVAGAFDTLFNALGTNATVFVPGVWSPKYRGFSTLYSVKVDDVPDVIRSRRPKTKTYEHEYVNTA